MVVAVHAPLAGGLTAVVPSAGQVAVDVPKLARPGSGMPARGSSKCGIVVGAGFTEPLMSLGSGGVANPTPSAVIAPFGPTETAPLIATPPPVTRRSPFCPE